MNLNIVVFWTKQEKQKRKIEIYQVKILQSKPSLWKAPLAEQGLNGKIKQRKIENIN